ncbi:MAG: hypothetical protein GY679_00060 [Mycoplasma sp.]|nr:hypothetical protein [Mycoplasma sp.]
MKQEKVVHFRVQKVVSHDSKGMPIIEDNIIKVSPEFQVIRYINLIKQQNNLSVEVVKVLQRDDDKSEYKEIKEIEKWQSLVNEETKEPEQVKDYKKAYEDQSKDIENLKAQMAELLAAKDNTKPKQPKERSDKRITLENKASELGIRFMKTIGDDNLLKRVQDVESEFNVE